MRSRVWRYQRDGAEALVSVDYPLEGFHNVKKCYANSGWKVLKEESLVPGKSQENLHAYKLTLNLSLTYAIVLHSVMDKNGAWLLAPPAPNLKAGLWQKLLGDEPVVPKPITAGYRIQLITGDYAPVSEADAAQAEELYFTVRPWLVAQMVGQLQPRAK